VKSKKENFYHGILLGLLRHKEQWLVKSNRESGDGYSDILVQVQERERRVGIVIEVKYSEDVDALDTDCKKALKQIEDLKYEAALKKVGIKSIKKYGIACFGKYCKVMMA
jgi:predicted AlkP superfamily phosphohydrolase/phosphomutase